MNLKPKELCPLHRRRDCCGRSEVHGYVRKSHSKWEQLRTGWRRIPDAENPRGFRYKLSPAAMKQVLAQKVREQNGRCALGGEEFTDYSQVAPDHISPKGNGGFKADDHPDNIQAACWGHNGEKGSMSMDQWRAYRKEKGLPYL